MANETFSADKLLGSFVQPLAWVKTISILIKIGLVLSVLWGIYVVLVKPHINPTPTTEQRAEQITNYNLQPKSYFGCQHFGLLKEEPKKTPEPKKSK